MKAVLISDTTALGILVARPEPAWRVRLTGLRNKDLVAPDYGAMHVAASLKAAGFDVQVVNMVADIHDRVELFREPNTEPDEYSGSEIAGTWAADASRKHLFDTLRNVGPDIILVSMSVYNLALFVRQLLGEIKQACPDALLVTGGIYATMNADEVFADGHADVVVRGEGEVTCVEMFASIAAGKSLRDVAGISFRDNGAVVRNRPREPIAELDSLPHPYTVSDEFRIGRRFELLSELLPHGDWIPGAGFLTSRGCPEGCTFCLDPALNNRRTRFHSPAYVRNVLDYCAANFRSEAGSFFFGDATFTMNSKRLGKLLALLDGLPFSYQIQTRADYLNPGIVKALANANFTTVAIGAESFNEEILQEVAGKRLSVASVLDAARDVREAGMFPMLTFIVGLPGETRDSIWRTVDMLKENGIETATFFPLVVFKGTALFEQFAQRCSPEEREPLRLNPFSEEFLFASDEFPTAEELTGFTQTVNTAFCQGRITGS